MKTTFKTRLEAIEWLARFAKDEGQFEVLREQLNFNYIYTGTFFIEIDRDARLAEVALLGK